MIINIKVIDKSCCKYWDGLDAKCSTCLAIVRHIHASEQKVVEGMQCVRSIGDCLHLPIQITIWGVKDYQEGHTSFCTSITEMGNIWDLAPITNQKDINRVACTCSKLTFNIPNWIYMQKETEILLFIMFVVENLLSFGIFFWGCFNWPL